MEQTEFGNLNELRKDLKSIFDNRDPKTGVLCPICGTEFLEEHPGTVFIGIPSQVRSECMGCGYITTISVG